MIIFENPRLAVTLVVTSRAAVLPWGTSGRVQVEVSEGEAVAAGQVLFRDRDFEAHCFVAPIYGTVEEVVRGTGNRLEKVVLRPELEAQPEGLILTGQSARDDIQTAGLWEEFRARPYGRIPKPDGAPDAIFVDALGEETAPNAVAIHGNLAPLRTGLEVICDLTDGPVFFSHAMASEFDPPHGRVRNDMVKFREQTIGHRICELHSVARGGEVWTISSQAVIAIGKLFAERKYDASRLIRVDGGGKGRLVRTHIGANLEEVVAHLFPDRTLESGPPRWLEPGVDETHAEGLLGFNGHRVHRPKPIVPTIGLEHALPARVRTIPFLRALASGDVEGAWRLGCTDFLEQDMRLATARCASGTNYARALRGALDRLEAEG